MEKPDPVLLSIIIPTLGRRAEPVQLLASLENSTFRNFEIIIADQNRENFLNGLIEPFYNKFRIRHLRLDFTGTSAAKNYGASFAAGRILSFPDDDAEYLPDTAEKALNLLASPYAAVFGRTVNRRNSDSYISYGTRQTELSLHGNRGLWIEATIFIFREEFQSYQFDENFGLGARYGASEGHDLVIRMLKDKKRLLFSPAVMFYHPDRPIVYDYPPEIRRKYNYSLAYAKLCLKHKMYFALLSTFIKCNLLIIISFFLKRRKLGWLSAWQKGTIDACRY
ncbi:MAG: hypothetical protein A2096_04775 [Spirochaetes bacterium GWF1_41_5]|nr:MAG: hypothetical protein A2096_04775 [Spirochaetes bacterium GWF1_41_5]HBE03004.1 hypothetical protein [Spirochaetia bacterium]